VIVRRRLILLLREELLKSGLLVVAAFENESEVRGGLCVGDGAAIELRASEVVHVAAKSGAVGFVNGLRDTRGDARRSHRVTSPRPARIVVLISGRGSNMRALVERSHDPAMGFEVVAVVADQPGAGGLAIARDLGVPTHVVAADPSISRARYDEQLAAAIEPYAPSLIVLAGFMRILSREFVARYAGRILNIHPALLPKYPGLHTHQRALEARDKEHGATVHFVTAELDAGPAVIQARVRVEPEDDAQSLAARVQVLEHRIYPMAVRWYCAGRLRYGEGHAWLDGEKLAGPIIYSGAEDR